MLPKKDHGQIKFEPTNKSCLNGMSFIMRLLIKNVGYSGGLEWMQGSRNIYLKIAWFDKTQILLTGGGLYYQIIVLASSPSQGKLLNSVIRMLYCLLKNCSLESPSVMTVFKFYNDWGEIQLEHSNWLSYT